MTLIYTIEIPIRLLSEANNSDHWAVKARRRKTHCLLIRNSLKNLSLCLPLAIKLIRQGRTQKKLDYDNLVHSCKSCRDCIANILVPNLQPGQADSDPRIQWQYDQQSGKTYALKIEIYQI